MTAATSARVTVPAGIRGGASRILPVAGASVSPPGRKMVQWRSRARRSASAAVFAAEYPATPGGVDDRSV
jgi:hypothetical protein